MKRGLSEPRSGEFRSAALAPDGAEAERLGQRTDCLPLFRDDGVFTP